MYCLLNLSRTSRSPPFPYTTLFRSRPPGRRPWGPPAGAVRSASPRTGVRAPAVPAGCSQSREPLGQAADLETVDAHRAVDGCRAEGLARERDDDGQRRHAELDQMPDEGLPGRVPGEQDRQAAAEGIRAPGHEPVERRERLVAAGVDAGQDLE